MRRFIFRLLVFCLLPMPLLYMLNYMADEGLKKSRNYYEAEWNDLFESRINANLLIIGSSRAWVHISPKILDSILHTNSYNMGLDASHFLMQYERFKLYLKYNKKPKYLIVSVDLTTFSETNEIPYPQQFLPYLNDADIHRMIMGYHNSFTLPQRFFPLFKYNGYWDQFFEGVNTYFGRKQIDTPAKVKGYLGVEYAWDGTFDQFKKDHPHGTNATVSEQSEQKFKTLIASCKTAGIVPVLVFTPVYHESLQYVNNRTAILQFYATVANVNNIHFLNYSQDALSYNRSYFYNSQHLNKKGAEIFSRHLARDLKAIIH